MGECIKIQPRYLLNVLWKRCEEEVDPDNFLNPERRTEFKESNIAIPWLKEKLENGPMDSKELKALALEEEGISKDALGRASRKLNVIKKRDGFQGQTSLWKLQGKD